MKYIIDTTVLVDYFRRKDKSKCFLSWLIKQKKRLIISSLTVYEIMIGCKTDETKALWRNEFKRYRILPFDTNAAYWAALIEQDLAKKRHSIDTADLCIAATAVANGLQLATHNWSHFEHIEELQLRRL